MEDNKPQPIFNHDPALLSEADMNLIGPTLPDHCTIIAMTNDANEIAELLVQFTSIMNRPDTGDAYREWHELLVLADRTKAALDRSCKPECLPWNKEYIVSNFRF